MPNYLGYKFLALQALLMARVPINRCYPTSDQNLSLLTPNILEGKWIEPEA